MTDSGQVVLTPTVSRFLRRAIFWIAIGTIIVLLGTVAISLSNATKSAEAMSGEISSSIT